jgi:tRNA U38,U39,U40 pseudouridine synthase TruA
MSKNVLMQGLQVLFEVEGKSFMYKQVRNMV